jgi:DNA polymerase elongation subunit (family B)
MSKGDVSGNRMTKDSDLKDLVEAPKNHKWAFCKIDPSKSTKEEILKEIERIKRISDERKNEEMSIKILINSFYGALGNKWFVAFNSDVAEAVTLQGQDLIKYAEETINKYFREFWHKDKDLHDKLGITSIVKPVTKPLVVYADTDSNYVCFNEVVNSCDFKGKPAELILKINEYRLKDHLNKCFDIYAKKWNTTNCQDFEMESISEAGIWLGKKKYVLDPIWQDGIEIESLSKIKPTGVEIVQSSTPPFVRKKLTELLKYLFSNKDNFSINNLVDVLRDIKNQFELQDPSDISLVTTANNLEKFIVNDATNFEVSKGCPIHVRAAGYYNFLLNQNATYKNKYELIKSGEKVKYYHVKTKGQSEQDIFAFTPGTYPYEFAPPMNHDEQFKRTVLEPLNRFIEVMGYPCISPNLWVETSIF